MANEPDFPRADFEESVLLDHELFAGALALMTAHAAAAAHERPRIADAIRLHLMRIAAERCRTADCSRALALLADHWAGLSHAGSEAQGRAWSEAVPPTVH